MTQSFHIMPVTLDGAIIFQPAEISEHPESTLCELTVSPELASI